MKQSNNETETISLKARNFLNQISNKAEIISLTKSYLIIIQFLNKAKTDFEFHPNSYFNTFNIRNI